MELARLKRRMAEVVAIDFFGAPGREAAEGLISGVEARMRKAIGWKSRARLETTRREDFRVKTWVTRKGIYMDRMASAWLIRRFIDPNARFKFVPAKGYNLLPGEIRFDMFEAEFTHEGDRCTLEVLIERMPIRSRACPDR